MVSNLNLMESRRRILLNTPHLESLTGSILSFKTDMASKLKECKVELAPKKSEGAVSGWDSVNVFQTGQNFFSADWVKGAIATSTGIFNDLGSNVRVDRKIPILPSSSMRLSWTPAKGRNIYAFSYKADGSFSRYLGLKTNSPAALTFNENEYYVAIYQYNNSTPPENVLLTVTSAGTEYEQYAGDSKSITFPQTIYGGSIDLNNGIITSDRQFLTLGESVTPMIANRSGTGGYANSTFVASTGCTFIHFEMGWTTEAFLKYAVDWDRRSETAFDTYDLVDGVISGSMASSIANTMTPGQACYHLGSDSYHTSDGEVLQYIYIALPGECTDLASKRAYLAEHPITMVYPLRYPVTYSVTPEAIKTLRGQNNIWSDANGNIELKFWTH